MIPSGVLAAVCLSIAAAPAPADVQPKLPGSPPPYIVAAAEGNKDAGEIIYHEVVLVPVLREEIVLKNGKQEKVTTYATVPTARHVKFSIKSGSVFDVKGNKLEDEAVWKRVAVGSAVLIAVDGKKVDPAYLQIVKDDPLILVPPPPKLQPERAPAPPPEIPKKP